MAFVASGHRFAAIHDKVDQHLLQMHPVTLDQRQVWRQTGD